MRNFIYPANRTLKLQYRIALQVGYVISIVFIVLILHLFPRMESARKIIMNNFNRIEVVEIPLFNEPPPPPPVQPKIEVPKTIHAKVVEKQLKSETIRDEIREDELKFDIDLDISDNLLANKTQMSDLKRVKFNLRNLEKSHINNSTFDSFNPQRFRNANANLDIGRNSHSKKLISSSEFQMNDMSLQVNNQSSLLKKEKKVKKRNSEFEILSDNEFILREEESTIGTAEYRTWNRINAVLDRLNKDRYGELPVNVKRDKTGLTITFTYNNGIRHDIYWIKGGQVIIRVTGSNPDNYSTELTKAYESLFKLTYKMNS